MNTLPNDALHHMATLLPNVILIPFSNVSRRFRQACAGVTKSPGRFMRQCAKIGSLELFKWGYSQHFLMDNDLFRKLLGHETSHNDETILQFARYLRSIWYPMPIEDTFYLPPDRYELAKALYRIGYLEAERLAEVAAYHGKICETGVLLQSPESVVPAVKMKVYTVTNCLFGALNGGQYNTAQILMLQSFRAERVNDSWVCEYRSVLERAKEKQYFGIIYLFVENLDKKDDFIAICESIVSRHEPELLHLIGRMYKRGIWIDGERAHCLWKQQYLYQTTLAEYAERNGCFCCGKKRSLEIGAQPESKTSRNDIST